MSEGVDMNKREWNKAIAFADSIADYLATRTKPWENAAEMREAVHDALRLTFTEARDDPLNPYSRRGVAVVRPTRDESATIAWQFNEAVSLLREARLSGWSSSLADQVDEGLPEIQAALELAVAVSDSQETPE